MTKKIHTFTQEWTSMLRSCKYREGPVVELNDKTVLFCEATSTAEDVHLKAYIYRKDGSGTLVVAYTELKSLFPALSEEVRKSRDHKRSLPDPDAGSAS